MNDDYDPKKKAKRADRNQDAGPVVNFVFYLAGKITWIFLVLAAVALALDMYPEAKRSEQAVETMIAAARGTHDSSTCMFYSGRLSKEETLRWQASAAAEGRVKCIEADAVLRQSPMIMKMREFVYRYIPWASGNLTGALQGISMYLVYATPIAGWLIRYLVKSIENPHHYSEFTGV